MIGCKQERIFLRRSFEMHLFVLWTTCRIFIILFIVDSEQYFGEYTNFMILA
jgi:hypothetical protein